MTPATLADRMEARAARYRQQAGDVTIPPSDRQRYRHWSQITAVLAQEIRTGLFEETEA